MGCSTGWFPSGSVGWAEGRNIFSGTEDAPCLSVINGECSDKAKSGGHDGGIPSVSAVLTIKVRMKLDDLTTYLQMTGAFLCLKAYVESLCPMVPTTMIPVLVEPTAAIQPNQDFLAVSTMEPPNLWINEDPIG
jgi:hypothetical protein